MELTELELGGGRHLEIVDRAFAAAWAPFRMRGHLQDVFAGRGNQHPIEGRYGSL